MNKDERIARYGLEAYEKRKKYARDQYYKNKDQRLAQHKEWNKKNPLRVLEANQQRGRKGGKHYKKHLYDAQTGLRGARNKIRCKDRRKWRLYKGLIAPNSILHHQWQPNSAKYSGVALVEKVQHQYGYIDVIEILEGKITLFSEEGIREQGQ